MKIAVCVKQVPEGSRRLDPETKRLDRSGEGALNPFDANAVEEALRLKEAGDDSGGGLVTMGPPSAGDAMRKALAMGADRAVLVTDDAAAGSDALATSRVLAAVLERESPDLVLFGQYAGDSEGAVLWAAVAERLRRPMVSQVAELTVEDGAVRGRRPTEVGDDRIPAPPPDGVRVRRHPRAAAGGDRRLRRDQRAALPVAQGDHGREEEAAGGPVA